MKKSFYLLIFLFCCKITLLAEIKFQIETVNADSGVLLVPQQYSTIQSAINHSSRYYDTILVSPGTYYENINFLGKRIVVKGNGPAESIIIDGSQPTDPNKASVVTFNSGEIGFSILDGFTITGGTGTNTFIQNIGGGIFIENSKAIIKNCIIRNNRAVRGGGVASFTEGYGILNNCLINNNTSVNGNGGGVFTNRGYINLNYCTVVNNSTNMSGSNLAFNYDSSSVRNSIIWFGSIDINQAGAGDFKYCDIQGGWPAGEGNIYLDPIFCDANLSDYHLASNSPCIGAGENSTTIGALGTCGQEYSRFDYPLEIGTIWNYKYDYDYSHMGDWSKRHGIHIWTVMDSSIFIDDFIRFRIASKNIDTVSSSYNPTPTLKIDTTYFYIDRGQNTIIVRPPSKVYPIVDNITGYFSGNDTLRVGGRVYVERIGLISLFDSNGTNTYYRQVQKLLEFNGNPVTVKDESSSLPTGFCLSQNYPNPFNPSTKISWQAQLSGWQTLKVYDVLGNEVATLVNEYRNAGNYEVEFNANNLPSGVYFYQLQDGDYLETKKMILLK